MFTAAYVCALDLTKIGAGTAAEFKTLTGKAETTNENKNYVKKFTETWTYGTNTTFDLHNIFGKQTLTEKQLKAALLGTGTNKGAAADGTPTSTNNNTFTLGHMLANNIVKIVGDIELLTGANFDRVNEYYIPALNGDGFTIDLTQKMTTNQPHFTADVPTKVSFKIQDAFGHEQKIQFTLTMKKPAEARQAR